MARRSATNPRYQKYTGPEGKTRKSAAAAKPKKASVGGGSKSGKPAGGNRSSRVSPLTLRNPTTPEFKAARRQWWIALAVGLAFTAISYGMQVYVKTPWSRTVQASILGIAYMAIGYAFYIDWKKMRPMRQAAYELQRSGKAPKPEKAAKASVKSESKNDAKSSETGPDAE